MSITKSAQKALRQSRTRRVFNVHKLKKMKELIKKSNILIKEKQKDAVLKLLPEIYKVIDKSAKRGIIKKNTANRKKSRLTKAIDRI